ncbi:MAG: type II toxin-antitoxin system VapC family toxin [Acidobacteria bacterium]|nr:type II toxin-antitoxin system VapC family toxin [Acidobacteriota bacterium]
MSYLLDSNILLRMAQPTHAMHAEATHATAALLRRGETIHVIPQILYEFWSVATREIQYNGLGLSIPDAHAELARLKTIFIFLPDSSAIYPEWERLVMQYAVKGRDSHDTRIVAAMNVHQLTHLLTFNKDDFKRFPSLTVLLPSDI